MRVLKLLLVSVLALSSVQSFARGYGAVVEAQTLWVGQSAALNACGGYVRTQKDRFGRVNLVFDGIRACSNFDIVDANGSYFGNYRQMKLPGFDGNRYGSFTLPNSITSWGFNYVRVVVKSNSGKHADYLNLKFIK